MIFSGTDNVIDSPPFIYVADVAMRPSTAIYSFFKAFFKADFVGNASNIPTPYSCNRIEVERLGTLWVSVCLILF